MTPAMPLEAGALEAKRNAFCLAYRRFGSLRRASEFCEVRMVTGFLWLKQSGMRLPDDGNDLNYPNETQRLGAAAEREFHRLVPDAVPANNFIRANNPTFDFTAYGVTIDVKYSRIRENGRWGWSLAHRKRMKPDFYALFFATGTSGELSDGYRLFLVPHEMFAGRSTMTMRPDHTTHPLNHYELAPVDLADALQGVLI